LKDLKDCLLFRAKFDAIYSLDTLICIVCRLQSQ